MGACLSKKKPPDIPLTVEPFWMVYAELPSVMLGPFRTLADAEFIRAEHPLKNIMKIKKFKTDYSSSSFI
jgi:hypothetical protein